MNQFHATRTTTRSSTFSTRARGIALLVAMMFGVGTQAQAQSCSPTCPTIRVSANTFTGGTVICYGAACEGVLAGLTGSSGSDMMEYEFPWEVDYETFCADLAAARDAACNIYPQHASCLEWEQDMTANACW